MTDVVTTHAEGCWAWNQKHHACAVREIERLRARVAELEEDRQAERDRILGARVREVLEANGTNPERFVSEWCRAQAEYEAEEAAR